MILIRYHRHRRHRHHNIIITTQITLFLTIIVVAVNISIKLTLYQSLKVFISVIFFTDSFICLTISSVGKPRLSSYLLINSFLDFPVGMAMSKNKTCTDRNVICNEVNERVLVSMFFVHSKQNVYRVM